MVEPLFCPFCGETSKLCYGDRYPSGNRHEDSYWVVCDNPKCEMEVSTSNHTTKEEAIEIWNKRFRFRLIYK